MPAETPLTPDQMPHEALRQQVIDPNAYLATVLDLYRQDESDYRGRRNEDQLLIAEYAAEEADEHFDGTFLGVLALTKVMGPTNDILAIPNEERQREITLGNLADGASLKEMRDSWRQLWVGFNVLTHRLRRDSDVFQQADLPEVFEMSAENKKLMLNTLFNNFQALNALRFGAEGSGVRRHRWVTNLDTGEPEKVEVDADLARNKKQIAQNAARRRYAVRGRGDSERTAIHPAGKMTPEEFRALRKQYPEVDMDQFAHDAAFLKDMAKQYEQNGE